MQPKLQPGMQMQHDLQSCDAEIISASVRRYIAKAPAEGHADRDGLKDEGLLRPRSYVRRRTASGSNEWSCSRRAGGALGDTAAATLLQPEVLAEHSAR